MATQPTPLKQSHVLTILTEKQIQDTVLQSLLTLLPHAVSTVARGDALDKAVRRLAKRCGCSQVEARNALAHLIRKSLTR